MPLCLFLVHNTILLTIVLLHYYFTSVSGSLDVCMIAINNFLIFPKFVESSLKTVYSLSRDNKTRQRIQHINSKIIVSSGHLSIPVTVVQASRQHNSDLLLEAMMTCVDITLPCFSVLLLYIQPRKTSFSSLVFGWSHPIQWCPLGYLRLPVGLTATPHKPYILLPSHYYSFLNMTYYLNLHFPSTEIIVIC